MVEALDPSLEDQLAFFDRVTELLDRQGDGPFGHHTVSKMTVADDFS